MRTIVSAAVIALTSTVLAQPGAPAAGGDVLARARALHARAGLIDGHNDFPWAIRERVPSLDLARLDIRGSQPVLMTDIPRLRAGGVSGQFWSVYVPASYQGQTAVRATLEQIDVVHRMIARYPDVVRAGAHGRRRRAHPPRRPDRVAHRRRGRALDRQLARYAADARGARRELHDADPHGQRAVGRRRHRQAGQRRAVAVRRERGRGDEPPRHAGGPEPRVARHDGRRAPRLEGAGHLLALVCARDLGRAAQRARRHPEAAGGQRWRGDGDVRPGVRLAGRRPGVPKPR